MARTVGTYAGLELIEPRDAAELEAWLEREHEREPGVWIKFAKKGSGVDSPTYEEARELAISFGWIDGLKNAWDETWYVLRFTRRRRNSKWSQINRTIAEELIAAGRMKPTGLAEVESARADGRWARAYPAQSQMTVPPDLEAALADSPKAAAFFPTISRANRFAILFRIHDAKTPENRAKQIAKLIAMLARREVLHPD